MKQRLLTLAAAGLFLVVPKAWGDISLRYLGGGELRSVGSCPDSGFAVLSSDGFLTRMVANGSGDFYGRAIAGDSLSAIKRPVTGLQVACLDSNTFFVRDTWSIYRISGSKLDTVTYSTSYITKALATDTLGNVYFESQSAIFKGEKSGPSKFVVDFLPGIYSRFQQFAVLDENNMAAAMDDSGLYYLRNGVQKRVPIKMIPGGRFLSAIARFGGKYLIADGSNIFVFNPQDESITPIPAQFSFGSGTRMSSAVFDNIPLFCCSSGGGIFSLQAGQLIKESFRDQRDSIRSAPFFTAIASAGAFNAILAGADGLFGISKISAYSVATIPSTHSLHPVDYGFGRWFNVDGRRFGSHE